jgi:alpha-beta hydrolase superfamily lysophospholipase
MTVSKTSSVSAMAADGAVEPNRGGSQKSGPRPVPASFGEPGRVISALYYPAAPGRQRDAVVVLCNAIGWEGIASSQTYRQLTARLASEGFGVLRFDYLGTGDSSGYDGDPGRLSAWLESVRSAIVEAKRLTGRQRVAVVGLHLGATLAALTAVQVGGVDSLVLWGPYTKGRAFVREARAFRALNDKGADGFPRAEDHGGLESAGFLLTAETLESLGTLDLTTATRAAAAHVLVLGRDTNGSELGLVKHLQGLGAQVEHGVASGWGPMMQEPRKSQVPRADLTRVVDFLSSVHQLEPVALRAVTSESPSGPRAVELDDRLGDVNESIISLDPDKRLYGVLTEGRGIDAPNKVAVFLLNTAAHPRVGPNRMYVPFARAIAKRGMAALRFDLTGLGDSASAPEAEGRIYGDVFVRDVVTAIDGMQKLGFSRFALIGLCSGAYLAFHAALADSRVAAALMVNPQTFHWKDGDSLEIGQRNQILSTSFYQRALLDPDTWRRAITGDIDFRTIGRAMADRAKHRAELELKRLLTKAQLISPDSWVDVGQSFQQLLDRGTTTHLIYSANDEGIDHLSSQVGSRLKRLRKHERFNYTLIDGPDHTFTQIWAQARLQEVLVEQLSRRFR